MKTKFIWYGHFYKIGSFGPLRPLLIHYSGSLLIKGRTRAEERETGRETIGKRQRGIKGCDRGTKIGGERQGT
jgi:hypothetical protein